MIEIKNIDKHFGENHILKNMSFTFQQGKTNLIIGESGSGKTSLIKIILGLIEPTDGNILLDNKNDIKETTHNIIAERLST